MYNQMFCRQSCKMRVFSLFSVHKPYSRYFSTILKETTVPLKLKSEYGLFINGEFRNSTNNKLIDIENPATGEILCKVHNAQYLDVEHAINCAENAFKNGDWYKNMDVRDRSHILLKCAKELQKLVLDYAYIESLQTGRPLREMNAQLSRLPEWLEYYACLIRTFEGTVPPFKGEYLNYVKRVPLGVCGLITPWNHPLLITIKKLAPALAAGNTVVIKPSELAPCTILEFAKLCTECGIPTGVLNVVPGYGNEAGKYICESPIIKKIDITGGTETGKKIGAVVGRNLAHYTAELGGKTPMIIFDDCRRIEQCVDGIAFASFIASGQTCIMGARLLIQDTIYDEIMDKLVKKVRSDIKCGDPQNLRTNFGPLISKGQQQKMCDFIKLANRENANILCGGKIPTYDANYDSDWNENGYYFEPTIIGDCTPEMSIVQNEIFGPIVVALKFSTETEAISIANNSEYGLAAAIWTSNMCRAYRVSNALDVGIIWINDHHRNDPSSVWGGMKQSGIGRENGIESFLEYTQSKSVVVNCNEQPFDWFAPESNARYG